MSERKDLVDAFNNHFINIVKIPSGIVLCNIDLKGNVTMITLLQISILFMSLVSFYTP